MTKFNDPLQNVRIASPCSADWNQMYGSERSRFCGDCKLNVYNLSDMTKAEAESLILANEGRLCVRFYRRNDGSIITKDCPVGWAAVKRRARSAATAAVSLMIALFTGVFFVSLLSGRKLAVNFPKIPLTKPSPEPLMGAIAFDPQKDGKRMREMGEIEAPRVVRTR